MSRTLDTQLGRFINVAALISLIASVLMIYFFVGALNRNAARTDRQLLTAGIETAIHHNETWVADYGWWSYARELLEQRAVDELSVSMASSFSDHLGFDFVVMASKDNAYALSWHRDSGETPLPKLLSEEQLTEIRADLAAAYQEDEFIGSHMLYLNGYAYIASATVVGEYDDRSATDPMNDPVLIIGTRIDQAFATDMASRFLVSDIAIVTEPDGFEGPIMEAVDHLGHSAVALTWTPSRPGMDTLRFTFLPLVFYIAAFFIAAQVIVHKARSLARRAERNEKRAVRAATTDSLSGLPNRLGFTQFTESEAASQAAAEGAAAVIYIDLNGFKSVNDKAGHRAGDSVIQGVARKFRAALPDGVHVARVGGDEFACALIGQAHASQALPIARALTDSLSDRFEFNGRQFEIGAAIGIAWSRPDAVKGFPELIHDADLAMYRAKADQLDHPLCYDASLGLEQAEHRTMEADIEAGLERREFRVVYQPIVRASDGSIASVEALLRWEHPTRGAVPPDVFIKVAERSSLIRKLGDFVVDSVCTDIGPNADYSVSINLSPVQLHDPELCARYLETLAAAGMSASQVELELTETVLVDDFEQAKQRLMEFHEAGFRVNLDDFGTGFASMGYLHMLPFSKIKVDRTFVSAIGKGDGPNKMMQALALLGDAMNLDMVAEGVETETQASMLCLLGFDYLQGWYYGPPMTARALQDRLAA
ncbi:putative bifunctional diguanylate cyclase/phosphodiesterase [Maricaulis parjimensis]|uniref:putative bifunctional diguanylate cyclase/phosphodiesterase n=1 Tax=Maricaulis parjimensis TaxID=144023 RepID=UPI00193AC663|nr:bifunctional diguanylate cyclase/phosphodiesterase [Maricaulis parjimensis]